MTCHLSRDELRVLAALSRQIIGADARVSDGELRVADDMARRLGLALTDWRAVWDDAIRTLPNAHAVMKAAEGIKSPDARELIYELVYGLAQEDDIVDREWDVLEWLDDTWRSADAESG